MGKTEFSCIAKNRKKSVSLVRKEFFSLSVRGSWSLWSEWGECSVTCENGTRTRTRECNHPPPNFGGTYCHGDAIQYKHCELPMCPSEYCYTCFAFAVITIPYNVIQTKQTLIILSIIGGLEHI